MRKKLVYIILSILIIIPVNAYTDTLRDVLNDDQYQILLKLTKKSNAITGYDDIENVIYISFIGNYKKDEIFKNLKKEVDLLYKDNKDTIIAVYETLLKYRYIIEFKALESRENKKWTKYYYLHDTLLKPTVDFVEILEKSIISNDEIYSSKLEQIKEKIKRYAYNLVQYENSIYGVY